MAQHRRVEPRNIVGTGMATDAERIRDVEAEHERRARAWRNAPERGFGDVLQEAPAKGALADDVADDPRRKKRQQAEAATVDAPLASATPNVPAPVDGAAARAAPAPKIGPKVPPDPRERLLREQLAKSAARPKGASTSDTPPTGNHARKPVR